MENNFINFFKNSLNTEQQKAVEPKDGVLLVCAGAGSGKTRVITARIANLILNHNVAPESILALTFTNKAANEMKIRVANFLSGQSYLPFVGTFHSFCLRLLKNNSSLISPSTFSLLDEDDQAKIVRKILNRAGLTKRFTPKHVISFISKVKNDGVTQLEREELLSHDRILREIYHAYEHDKRAAYCLDFDDLLVYVLNLFDSNPEFKENFQKGIKHVLVDEYQDTNKIQHALLKQMANNNSRFVLDSLCVVGDEDQSIYSWRGATVSNIMNFKDDFEKVTSIVIDQNYRSVQPILDTANHVIQNNKFRNPKNLWSSREASDRIRLLTCSSNYQESEAIALYLKKAKIKKTLSSNAILYRSHFQSRSIEETLIRYAIPYKIIGGLQFYDRLEIKDILAYLRLIVNPFDKLAFSRVINTPSRGLGEKFEELFLELWAKEPLLNFKEAAKKIIEEKLLTAGRAPKSRQDALIDFIKVFEDLSINTLTSECVNTILFKTNYYNYLKNSFEPEEAHTKKENIKELISSINYFEAQNASNTVELFLQEVSLLQELLAQNEQNDDYVRLMTLHAAKGLEFDTVILPGVEEGIIPSAHTLFNPENLEEERRLLYVGITRAREKLIFTCAKRRYMYGQLTEQRESRFVDEFPDVYVQREDCSYWDSENIENYFNNWQTSTNYKVIPKAIPAKSIDKPKSYGWYIKQQVEHEAFGTGTVEKIEDKNDKIYLTVKFKNALKKIDSNFLKCT